MSTIPLLLCGKSPTLAKTFTASLETLSKDYKIVHVCHDLPSSKREINALLRGEPVTPESGLGTNAEKGVATVVPKGIVIGKGFSEEEIGELRSSCVGEGRKVVAWLVADDEKMTWTRIAKVAVTAGTGLPVVVAQRVIECMQEHGVVPGKEGDVEGFGDVWGF